MMLVVGVAFRIVRMGEAMRVSMVMGAGIAGAAGIVVVIVVVHGAGVPRAGAPVNRRVIA
jgi:hypothetical protein